MWQSGLRIMRFVFLVVFAASSAACSGTVYRASEGSSDAGAPSHLADAGFEDNVCVDDTGAPVRLDCLESDCFGAWYANTGFASAGYGVDFLDTDGERWVVCEANDAEAPIRRCRCSTTDPRTPDFVPVELPDEDANPARAQQPEDEVKGAGTCAVVRACIQNRGGSGDDYWAVARDCLLDGVVVSGGVAQRGWRKRFIDMPDGFASCIAGRGGIGCWARWRGCTPPFPVDTNHGGRHSCGARAVCASCGGGLSCFDRACGSWTDDSVRTAARACNELCDPVNEPSSCRPS